MSHKQFANKYEKHGGYHWSWYKSKESYKQYVDFLKEWVEEKNVLDIGAGDGLITHVLGIKGVDNDPFGIKAAKKHHVEIELGDAYHLESHKDEEFDSVLMSHTLEHLEYPIMALTEARRVLKKYIYIAVPKREGYFNTNPVKLKKMVEWAGFKLVGQVHTSGDILYGKFKKV